MRPQARHVRNAADAVKQRILQSELRSVTLARVRVEFLRDYSHMFGVQQVCRRVGCGQRAPVVSVRLCACEPVLCVYSYTLFIWQFR